MKVSFEELRRKAEGAMRSALEGIPFAEIQGIDRERVIDGRRADLVTIVRTPAGTRYFVADIKPVGQPRAARDAINQLWRFRQNRPDIVPVFIAPYVSHASADLCRQEGTSYVDLSGNCRLVFDNAFVEREGRPNAFAVKRDLRSLYSTRASRVLRVLLANPGEAWRIKDLAKEADVSLGLASNVKRLLEDREWVRKTEDGLALVEPVKLLGEWAENHSFRRNGVRDCYSPRPVGDLEADLAAVCRRKNVPYALTGLSAAARLVPTVRSARAMAYVRMPLDQVVSFLGLRDVAGGANVTLLEPHDEGVFYGVDGEDGFLLASPVQVYLDLKALRGRGEEAAASLLDEVIRPQW